MKIAGMAFGLLALISGTAQAFVNGEIWPDDHGVHVNAHGGGVIWQEDRYWWYGEHKVAGGEGNTAAYNLPGDDNPKSRAMELWLRDYDGGQMTRDQTLDRVARVVERAMMPSGKNSIADSGLM